MTDKTAKSRGSKRLRGLGVAALMVGGSAAAAVAVGGQAFAKMTPTCSPSDKQANDAFKQLPAGLHFTRCNGALNGTIDVNKTVGGLIGQKLPVGIGLPIDVIKIHADPGTPPS